MSKSATDSPHALPQRARAEGDAYLNEKTAALQVRLQRYCDTLEKLGQLESLPDAALLAGIERWYSAAEVAEFFGRSNQWIYDRFKKGKFVYRNGDPIVPVYTGGPKKPRMRFNLPLVKALADSCYRDGIVKREELELILKRVAVSEYGELVCDDE